MMRPILRYVFPAVTLTITGLFLFTAETVVDEVGWTAMVRKFIRQGWSAMSEAGYTDFLEWALFFSLGATFAVWADFAFRKLQKSAGSNVATRYWHRLWPRIKWSENPEITWTRSGDQPHEISSAYFTATNLTGKPIRGVKLNFKSENGPSIKAAMIGSSRAQRPVEELDFIEEGASFTVVTVFGPDTAPNHEATKTGGINGLFSESFVNRFGNITMTFQSDRQRYSKQIRPTDIQIAINRSLKDQEDQRRSDGVHFIDRPKLASVPN